MRLIYAADGAPGAAEVGEVLGEPAPLDRRQISPADPPDPDATRLIATLARLYAYPGADPTGAGAQRPADRGGDTGTRTERPWLRANMVSSADGAATAAGRSGGLSGPADRVLFGVLRSLADVILVGASTARIERYRPPGRAAIWPQLRQGRPPLPRIAVVTRRLALDLTTPLFNPAPGQPPIIVITTESAPAERMAAVSKQAELIIAGAKQVAVGTALAALASRGYGQILTEGGPALLAELAIAGALSELCLTISPRLEGGLSPRIVNPAAPDTPSPDTASPISALKLMTVLEHEGSLLCRYKVG